MDFPGGPVVKNPPFNTGNASSIPSRGIKIPHAMGRLSLLAATTEPTYSRARAPQPEKALCHDWRNPAHHSKEPPCCKIDPAQPEEEK